MNQYSFIFGKDDDMLLRELQATSNHHLVRTIGYAVLRNTSVRMVLEWR